MQEIIYVGKAVNPITRTRQHLNLDNKKRNTTFSHAMEIDRVEVCLCENDAHARVLEKWLIVIFNPKYNTQDKSDYIVETTPVQPQWYELPLI